MEKYVVKITEQVGYNTFQTKTYDTYYNDEQAYDVAHELQCQGINAFVKVMED